MARPGENASATLARGRLGGGSYGYAFIPAQDEKGQIRDQRTGYVCGTLRDRSGSVSAAESSVTGKGSFNNFNKCTFKID